MAPKLFFHLHAEPSAFYLAYSSEIVHVEESWEGNTRMQGPETVLEFDQHALVYALHPSKDLLLSIHEDGSLRCTQCLGNSTSWTSRILTQVPQLVNKEIYGLYLMKTSECRDKDVLIEGPTGSLLIFIGSNEADYICYNFLEDKLLSSSPIRLPNHFKHPYLEYYSAPKPTNLMDLLRHHQKDFTSDNYMSLGDIKDIQLFPKAFYILDTSGNLSQYSKDLRIDRVQTEVVGFCLRRAYGSCIQKNGTVLTWKLPFKLNPESEEGEDVEHLSRPALLRKTLKASQELGKVNKLISENSVILTQYGLLPMLNKSKIQTNFSVTKDDLIKLKLINLLEMDLNGDYWFLKVRISPYNSSEQFYQVFRLPSRLTKLESWFVYLNLPEAIKTPKYLPLGLQLFFVFIAPQKIRIQSRPLTQTQLTAFDFLQVVQESETPIQKTRMTHTSSQESLRDYLQGLNARRRVAKSLIRESSISLKALTEKLTFNVPKSIIESQSTLSRLTEYSELKIFGHEYSCYLQMKNLEEGMIQLTFKNINEILFGALKRGIVSLRQKYSEEGNSTQISREILQNLRTARQKVEALTDSNDMDKYRETYVFVRTKVSNTLL